MKLRHAVITGGALLAASIFVYGAARTVLTSEIGTLYFAPNGFDYPDIGCFLNSAKTDFSKLSDQTIKVAHGRFHIFMPDDQTTWCWFPFNTFKTYETTGIANGWAPLFVTATYQGTHRPVYYVWDMKLDATNKPTVPASQWHQAVNVSDDHFIDFWVNQYVKPIAWSTIANRPNHWMGADECAFNYALYGVISDSGTFVPSVKWDSPFPQNNAEFLVSIETFFKKLKTNYPDVKVMTNIGSLADPATFPTVFADVPGLMTENFNVPSPDSTFVRNQFYHQILNYGWFGDQGKVALLRSYTASGDTAGIRTALVVYLMVRGANFFFAPEITGQTLAYPLSAYSGMRSAIGLPTGAITSTLQSGQQEGYRLYSRPMEKGIIYLNMTGVSQNVALPAGKTYTDENNVKITTLTIADRTGRYVIAASTANKCDPNGDGKSNVADVQVCVNQSTGQGACTTDVNGDGKCNVVDVQRIINAALGGPCNTNP